MGDLATTCYLFVIALVLALLEVQIEGPHGWASSLPTWRFDHPRWLALANGKPVTGYHVCMIGLLLLLFHFPAVREPWSWRAEGELLSQFFLVAVFWDFLWFVLNPHYGLRRFRAGEVWWCKRWALGLPVDYWSGIAVSLGLGLVSANPGAAHGAQRWAATFGVLCGLTLLTAAAASLRAGAQAPRDSA
ncbi:MAG: hypothetical protein AAB434_08600 [Planctomycetota bacterium]